MRFARARAARGGTSRRGTGAAVLLAFGFAGAAFAQAPDLNQPTPRPAFPPDLMQTLPAGGYHSQRPIAPLPTPVALRVQRGIDLRVSGLPDRARDTLLAVLRLMPHHAVIVTELDRKSVV